jgi:hypothetical protein
VFKVTLSRVVNFPISPLLLMLCSSTSLLMSMFGMTSSWQLSPLIFFYCSSTLYSNTLPPLSLIYLSKGGSVGV